MQGRTAIAEIEELLDDALIDFGRADDWFDIYKCLECLFELYGGEHEFYKLKWEPKDKIKLAKRTADSYRHAKRARPGQKPPPNPMKIGEAKDLLAILLQAFMREETLAEISRSYNVSAGRFRGSLYKVSKFLLRFLTSIR